MSTLSAKQWLRDPKTAQQVQDYLRQFAPQAQDRAREAQGIIAGGCIADALFTLWDQANGKTTPLTPPSDVDIFTRSPTHATHGAHIASTTMYNPEEAHTTKLIKSHNDGIYQYIYIHQTSPRPIQADELLDTFDLVCCSAAWQPCKTEANPSNLSGLLITHPQFHIALQLKEEPSFDKRSTTANALIRLCTKVEKLGLTNPLDQILAKLANLNTRSVTNKIHGGTIGKLTALQTQHPELFKPYNRFEINGITYLKPKSRPALSPFHNYVTQDIPSKADLPKCLQEMWDANPRFTGFNARVGLLRYRQFPITKETLEPCTHPHYQTTGWHEAAAHGRLDEAMALATDDQSLKTTLLSCNNIRRRQLKKEKGHTVVELAAFTRQLPLITQRFPHDPEILAELHSPEVLSAAARGWSLDQIPNLTIATLTQPITSLDTPSTPLGEAVAYNTLAQIPNFPELPHALRDHQSLYPNKLTGFTPPTPISLATLDLLNAATHSQTPHPACLHPDCFDKPTLRGITPFEECTQLLKDNLEHQVKNNQKKEIHATQQIAGALIQKLPPESCTNQIPTAITLVQLCANQAAGAIWLGKVVAAQNVVQNQKQSPPPAGPLP